MKKAAFLLNGLRIGSTGDRLSGRWKNLFPDPGENQSAVDLSESISF